VSTINGLKSCKQTSNKKYYITQHIFEITLDPLLSPKKILYHSTYLWNNIRSFIVSKL